MLPLLEELLRWLCTSKQQPPRPLAWGVSRGAGDENRTRALSLGSCDHLGAARVLTWANGVGASPASAASPLFPAVPRPILCGCGARNLMEHVVLASCLRRELRPFRLRQWTTRRD